MKSFLLKFIKSGFITVISGIVSVFFGLLLLFQTLRLPAVSVVSLITEPRVVKLSVTMFILTVITLLLALCKKTVARYIILGFAVAGLLCCIIVTVCNLSVASRQGADISLSLAVSGEKDSAAADVEIDSYTQFEGSDIGLSLWKPVGVESGAPVIVFIHGGGWMNDNRFLNGDMHHCRYFAEHGYLVVSVDYPLATKDHPMYDSQEDTIAQAVVWLNEHAAEYGGDISRLYFTGGSAGGNLALNVSARINKGEFDELFGENNVRVNAVSVLFPATNITSIYNTSPAPLGFLLKSMCTTNWGGTPEEYPERYAQNSSDLLVDENMAPVFTVYGKNDHMVSYTTIESFLDTLDGLNVENSSVSFPFADHLCDTCGSIESQTWRSGTVEWFNAH